MPCVTRRPLAEADILEIWDYIAEGSFAAADRWIDELDGKFKLIATQPLMGRMRDELSPRLRSFAFGRYVIFYHRSTTVSTSCESCIRRATPMRRSANVGSSPTGGPEAAYPDARPQTVATAMQARDGRLSAQA